MSLPRYPEYKDSRISWLGQVPAHWELTRLKFIATVQTGIAKGKDNSGKDTIEVAYLRVANVQDGYLALDDIATIDIPLQDLPRYRLRPGDVLMNEGGDFDKLGRGHIWRGEIEDCIHQNHVFAVRPHAVSSEWLNRITSSDYAQFYFMSRSKQSTNLASISSTNVMELPVLLPSHQEQTAIAMFLDRETTKIDALIAEQGKLLNLLAEKRQATISHAVTKGLNADVPMKDSGIEWLGEVPAHWDVRRISSVSTKITNGFVGPTRDILKESGVRYLQSLHIKQNRILFETPYYVDQEWSNEHSKSILREGDVLIVQTGDIGQVAVVTEEFSGCNCHALIIISPVLKELSGAWLSQVLNSSFGFHSLLSIQTGALHPHLNCGNVKELYVPVPPLQEQSEILSHLGIEISQMDMLTEQASRSITLLKERRSALISAAVTGKIDVRGAVPVNVPELEAT